MKKTYFLMTILASAGLFISSASSMNICTSPYYDKNGYPYEDVIEAKLTKEEQKYLSTILNARGKMTQTFKKDTLNIISAQDVNQIRNMVKKDGEKSLFIYKEILREKFTFLNSALTTTNIDLLKYLLSLPNLKNILINCPSDKDFLTTPLMDALKFNEDGWLAGSDLWLDIMKILVENGAIVCESFMRKLIGREIEYPKYEKIENITTLKFEGRGEVKVFHDRLTRFMNWYKKYEKSKAKAAVFYKKILKNVNKKNYTDIEFAFNN